MTFSLTRSSCISDKAATMISSTMSARPIASKRRHTTQRGQGAETQDPQDGDQQQEQQVLRAVKADGESSHEFSDLGSSSGKWCSQSTEFHAKSHRQMLRFAAVRPLDLPPVTHHPLASGGH